MSDREYVYPTGKLTFIIRDEAPFVHIQEPVAHRTVSIELTPWQMELLALRFTHSTGGNRFHECVSSVFLEPGVTDIPPQPAIIPTAALDGEGVRAAIEKAMDDVADVADVLIGVMNSEKLSETTRGALVGCANALSAIDLSALTPHR